MACNKKYKLPFGVLGEWECSLGMDRCGRFAFLGDKVRIEDLHEDFVPQIVEFIKIAYRIGKMDKAREVSNKLKSLIEV